MQTAIREEFEFLNRLRESGKVNMFGAAPYVEMEFGVTRREARIIVSDWMSWVSENPSNRDL
jgi:hypothetical protein